MQSENEPELRLTSEEKFEILMPSKKQIVMFTASWCAPCKTMKRTLAQIIESGSDITFKFVDLDANEEWAMDACGIKSVPTFLVFENGQEKKRLVGVQTIDSIKSMV